MILPKPSEISMDSLSNETLARLREILAMNEEWANSSTMQKNEAEPKPAVVEDSTQFDSQEQSIIIILDIGGRKFKTETGTLCAESGLFRHQLSDQYPWSPQDDGSYFLDTDPELFEHLLRFMRRPSVFPLFYDKVQGFDYGLYARLQAEAKYFQIDTLSDWIKEKKYQSAIKVETSLPIVRELTQSLPETNTCNITHERHVVPRTKKVYLCPRQIPVHRGRAELCGAACHKRQAENIVEYEEEVCLEVVSIKKEVVFDESVCILL